jgi:hypothetical protein
MECKCKNKKVWILVVKQMQLKVAINCHRFLTTTILDAATSEKAKVTLSSYTMLRDNLMHYENLRCGAVDRPGEG